MITDWTIGGGKPAAQLALSGTDQTTVSSWLTEEGLGFTALDVGNDGFPPPSAPLGGEPVVIRLDPAAMREGHERAHAALMELAARVPIIAIVDAETVELLPNFFDVEPAEFVALSCGKGAFMNALNEIASPSLRERVESRTVNPDALREEVERIARALSALVENTAPPVSNQTSPRTARESAQLVRSIIRRRRARAQFFPADLFADPAWDILLDLAAARLEGTRVSISSLCIAAAVPTTTALRWIKGMTGAGLLEREDDPEDGRRSFVRLSDRTAQAMENYLTMIEEGVV